jgi:pyruvate/2-oxoglutarate dehydrogenase complex dihydrolipoamide acyltransferase (E2) component
MPTNAGPAREREHDQYTSLTHGERWFVDGFAVIPGAGGVASFLCDMTQAQATIQALRDQGLRATYSHLVVRATALALRRYPEAHQLLCGYTRVHPARIDIGLSVAGQTSYAPVLIVEGADERPLPELVRHLLAAVPATREKEQRDLQGMKRTGWIIPFGAVRRWILRRLGRSFWFRRRLIGTFQVTCVPGADLPMPMLFYSGAMVSIGGIREHVLAIGGRPEVRLAAWLCVPFDHRTMDGRIASTLLQTIRQVLESPELLAEAGVHQLPASAESPDPLAVLGQAVAAPSAEAVTDRPARA